MKRSPSLFVFNAFSNRLVNEELKRPFPSGQPPKETRLRIAPPPPGIRLLGLARRDPPVLRCIMCDRPGGAEHGQPVDVGGELVVPACEAIHPGGLVPYGPPDPVVRSYMERRRRAFEMPMPVAKAIIGSLGAPSKLPGASYGLEAKDCMVGSELVKQPGSVCHGCYALKNFYAYWWPAKKARWVRQRAIRHPMWVEAMIRVILDYLERGGERYFRWHDSGDLQSVEHLMKIVAICEVLPQVHFWLPTREYGIVGQWRREGGRVPRNLVIRLSAHWVGRPPDLQDEILSDLPTSTVHEGKMTPPIAVSDRRADSIACRAWTRDNQCGKCRACWSPDVRNVSYAKH